MVTLAGAEAVVADGVAAAGDPRDGTGREDVETDGLSEVTEQGREPWARDGASHTAISTSSRGSMKPSGRCLAVLFGRLPRRTLAGQRGLLVVGLAFQDRSL
jgi:hypothetical protein